MLPSMSVLVRRHHLPQRRALALAGGIVLAAAALLRPVPPDPGPAGGTSVAAVLAPDTWALTLPAAWLATPVIGPRPGDRLDVLALRPGDRATATAIAFDLLVISADDRGLVVGCTADDATAVAIARASGLLLVPLLRSTR